LGARAATGARRSRFLRLGSCRGIRRWTDDESGTALADGLRLILPSLRVIRVALARCDSSWNTSNDPKSNEDDDSVPVAQLRQAVRRAIRGSHYPQEHELPVGIAELNCFGDIVSVNSRALSLFGNAFSGHEVSNIRDFIRGEDFGSLATLFRQWIEVEANHSDDKRWHLCATWLTHRMKYLLVILDGADEHLKDHSAVKSLLGMSEDNPEVEDEKRIVIERRQLNKPNQEESLEEVPPVPGPVNPWNNPSTIRS